MLVPTKITKRFNLNAALPFYAPLQENKHDKLEEQHNGELYDGYHFLIDFRGFPMGGPACVSSNIK